MLEEHQNIQARWAEAENKKVGVEKTDVIEQIKARKILNFKVLHSLLIAFFLWILYVDPLIWSVLNRGG